jgi:hypothetical protein
MRVCECRTLSWVVGPEKVERNGSCGFIKSNMLFDSEMIVDLMNEYREG